MFHLPMLRTTTVSTPYTSHFILKSSGAIFNATSSLPKIGDCYLGFAVSSSLPAKVYLLCLYSIYYKTVLSRLRLKS